ncbi:zeta toxin family protein [Streptomyces chartreusis]|uniref:zeta toxin family protein n=1 Tax=Streptomyces chartreusis TaxID=1969 RepID=UPI0033EE3CF6
MPQANPVVVHVMAQPGAGKSENRHLVRGREKATRICGDEFKVEHPAYLMLLAANPRTAGERIRPVYKAWQRRVEGMVRRQGGDLVVEISPGPPQEFLDDVSAFRGEGYRVELVVLAVREADSWQGIGLRYAQAYRENSPSARFTSATGHHACFRALARVVEAVEAQSAVDSLKVVRRDGTVLHHSERDAAGLLPPGAVEALREEWWRAYTNAEAAVFRDNQKRLYRDLPMYQKEWERIEELAGPLMSSVN